MNPIRCFEKLSAPAATLFLFLSLIGGGTFPVNAQPNAADREIAESLKTMFDWNVSVDSSDLKWNVKDGLVTLSGAVQSPTEKRAAKQAALSIPGVRGVSDQVTVRIPAERSDEEILADVKQRLWNDQRFHGHALFVQVRDGRVALSGVLNDETERMWARLDGWAVGVKEVDTSEILLRDEPSPSQAR